jgi:aldose 1-epimerase
MIQSAMPSISRSPFGLTRDGEPVEAFDLANGRGLEMRVITYGAIIAALCTPDRDGRLDDVVLGHDELRGYLDASPYFGAVVGRYANRIARGRFSLDGVTYQLPTNDGANHLHGGVRGFDKVVWSPRVVEGEAGPALELTYRSADGEEGYPGNLTATVTYSLTDGDELAIDYVATTDRATPVSLAQHSYWNLAGGRASDVLGHELTIHAGEFTPTDASLIPTGELASVAGTPFDFRTPVTVGARVGDAHKQLRMAGGYDHNFVLQPPSGEPDGLRHAAHLHDPITGRALDVRTSEPGMQFYSGNFLDGSIRGKGGRVYGHRAGLCLETQHFPDSPNNPDFPSAILRPGREYRSRTVVAFSTSG